MHPDHEGTPRFQSHTVVSLHHTDFHHKFGHGTEAFVLICSEIWVLSYWSVRLEKRVSRWRQLRKMVALHTAQLGAVTQELKTQRAATAQAEVRCDMGLSDPKLLTNSNMYTGEDDDKERLLTWSFKMQTYWTAVASRLRELMWSASRLRL